MAQKRLNTPLLIALVAGFLLLSAGAAGAYLYATHFDEEQTVAEGRAFYDQGEYMKAAGKFGRAARKVGNNPEYFVLFADAISREGGEDEKHFKSAISALQQAVQIDPDHEPSLRRLIDILAADIEGGSTNAQTREQLQERAEALLRAAPGDPEARFELARLKFIAAELGEVGDDVRDEARTDLLELAGQGAVSGRAVYWLTRTELGAAARAARGGDEQAAKDTIAAAADRLDEIGQNVQPGPDAAEFYLNLFRSYSLVRQFIQDEDQRQQAIDAGEKYAQAAVDAAQPADDSYDAVRRAVARYYNQSGRRDQAEAMLREALEAKPYDLGIARELADVIASDEPRTGEAVALLERDFPPAPPLPYREARERPEEEGMVSGDLAKYYLTLANLAKTEEDKRGHLDAASQRLDRYVGVLNRRTGGNADLIPEVLRLRGELKLLQGRPAEAIALLENARTRLESAGSRGSETRLETLFLLFKANLELNQTAPAREAITQLIELRPTYPEFHFQLASLLAQENRNEEALASLNKASELDPDNPRHAFLRAQLTGGDEAEAVYAALPEETERDKKLKRAQAVRLNNLDEVERLSRPIFEADPTNEAETILLAQVLARLERQDEALAVLEQSIAAAGGPAAAPKVNILRAQLQGESVTDLLAETGSDLQKALIAYRQAKQVNDMPTAMAELQKAAAAASTDVEKRQVDALLFREQLAADDFDAARQYVEQAKARDLIEGGLYQVNWLIAQDRLDEAGRTAEQLRSQFGSDARAALVLAKVREAQGRTDDATSNYEIVRQKQPTNSEALEGLIRLTLAAGRPQEAKYYIDEAQARRPGDRTFEELAVNWELQYGDPLSVLPEREALAEQYPDRPAVKLALATAYRAAARKLSGDGKEQDAAAQLRKARDVLQQIVADSPDFSQLGRVVTLLAETHRALGEPQKGLAAIDAAGQTEQLAGTDELALTRSTFQASTGDRAGAVQTLRDQLATPGEHDPQLRQRLSQILLAAGQPDEALAALEGDDIALQRLRVETMLNLGRLEDARGLAADRLESEPEDVALLTLAAFTEIKAGEPAQAKPFIERAVDAAPDDPRVLYVRGMYRLSGDAPDFSGAGEDLQQVVLRNPSNRDARRLLAQVALRQGEPERAAAELERAVASEPGDLESRVQLAQLYQQLNPPRFTQATRVLSEGLQGGAAGAAGEAVLTREQGLLARRRGDASEANRLLAEAARLSGNDPNFVQVWLESLLAGGDTNQVLAVTEQLLQNSAGQSTWWLHRLRAAALASARRPQDAANAYAAAVDAALAEKNAGAVQAVLNDANRLGSNNVVALMEQRVMPSVQDSPQWQLVYARHLYQAKQFDKAAAAAATAEAGIDEQSPLYLEALRQGSSALLEQQPPKFDEARQKLDAVVERQPDDLAALNNLAYALTLSGGEQDIDRAVELSTKAVERLTEVAKGRPEVMSQSGPYIIETNGWALVLDGQAKKGVSQILQAINMSPFATAYLHLAEAYTKLGNEQQAREAAQAGLEQLAREIEAGKPMDPEDERRLRELAS